MDPIKITQAEAERLIRTLKYSLEEQINFPGKGEITEFKVAGEQSRDVFVVAVFRGKINGLKYNISARILMNGIMLMELHINPSNIHIKGNHWHIYHEKYGRLWAFPAENIASDRFIENTVEFLVKFNVVKRPEINFQPDLTDR